MRVLSKFWALLTSLSGETRLNARIQAHAGCQTCAADQIKAAMTDLYDGVTRCC